DTNASRGLRERPLFSSFRKLIVSVALDRGDRTACGIIRQVAALLTRTSRPASSLWTPRPGAFGCGSGCSMVEIILGETQLARLKAAVTKGSVEHAALEAGDYFAGGEITPEP